MTLDENEPLFSVRKLKFIALRSQVSYSAVCHRILLQIQFFRWQEKLKVIFLSREILNSIYLAFSATILKRETRRTRVRARAREIIAVGEKAPFVIVDTFHNHTRNAPVCLY
jgi:hypothetical protein